MDSNLMTIGRVPVFDGQRPAVWTAENLDDPILARHGVSCCDLGMPRAGATDGLPLRRPEVVPRLPGEPGGRALSGGISLLHDKAHVLNTDGATVSALDPKRADD